MFSSISYYGISYLHLKWYFNEPLLQDLLLPLVLGDPFLSNSLQKEGHLDQYFHVLLWLIPAFSTIGKVHIKWWPKHLKKIINMAKKKTNLHYDEFSWLTKNFIYIINKIKAITNITSLNRVSEYPTNWTEFKRLCFLSKKKINYYKEPNHV